MEQLDDLFLWAENKVIKVSGEYKGSNARDWDERHRTLRILKILKPRIKHLIKSQVIK